MFTAPHRIRRQRWTVHTGSAAEAFAWRQLLRDQGQDLLQPLLERAFDEAARGDRIVYIPKLELKVSIPAANQTPEALLELISQQLREQLHRALQAPVQPTGTTAWEESPGQTSRFDILLHYLRRGSVPWPEASTSASERARTLTETCRAAWPHLLDYLRDHFESPTFYFRLLQLITPEAGNSLVSALADRIAPSLRPVLQWAVLGFDSPLPRLPRYQQLQLAAGLLAACLAWKEGAGPLKFVSLAFAALPPEARQVMQKLVAALPAAIVVPLQPTKPDADRKADTASVTPEISVFSPPVPVASGATPGAGLNRDLLRIEVAEPFAPVEPEFSGPQRPTEGLFPLLVHQAGLVVLHPFLPRFFKNTALMEPDNPRISAFALARAAALLHFLATGTEEVYEFELGLIKVLLGLHPETPLPACAGLLQPGDVEEAEVLLQSAITHWSALKNTSIQGLRASFLQRQALLREAEHGWTLQVERLPFDLLLDQLPWSIGIVKLPWMKTALYTEW